MSAQRASVTPLRRVKEAEDDLEQLRDLIRPDFLEEAGWNPQKQVLAPPPEHPVLGRRVCTVVDCRASIRTRQLDLCIACEARYRRQGQPPMEQFIATASGKRSAGERICVGHGCERPVQSGEGLCYSHKFHRRKQPDIPLEIWLVTSPHAAPYPGFGDCRTASCIRTAANIHGLCLPHQYQWRDYERRHADADRDQWLATAPSVALDYMLVLKGLPERVQLEFLLALQVRTDAGVMSVMTVLRAIATLARNRQCGSLFELETAPVRNEKRPGALIRLFCRDLRRLTTTPEAERSKDVWDLGVMGMPGFLDFTGLSQDWLREAAKHWAAEGLSTHRGTRPHHFARCTVNALARLSEILRLSREDDGNDLATLGRKDIVNMLNRLAYQANTERISNRTRIDTLRRVRRFLDTVRMLGLTGPGRSLEGLPSDFALREIDVPRAVKEEHGGRDLPVSVMRALAEHLHLLEQRSGKGERRAVEILIDTGRRPDEICRLPLDCLERDPQGKPVLVYTDFKNNRQGRRLPIAEATAALILAQKDLTRERFPDTPAGDLPLFPGHQANRKGIKPMLKATLVNVHRDWVDMIAGKLLDEDGQPFDPTRAVLYAYRHSYAQRHADNGATPDVLRDLMGHKSMQTTLSYYRITETRVRGAVDRVARHQFDSHGNRLFSGVASLLAEEHARLRVGQVAVPFGICTEPSNVKAGGQACPYKFTCLGCGHFRSDASYLPELKSYLQQLLADRERLHAATNIDGWARDQLMPRDEEVDQLRRLIRRIEQDMDDLTDEEQEAITDAVKVIRKARQAVSLGMPSIRSTATEAK